MTVRGPSSVSAEVEDGLIGSEAVGGDEAEIPKATPSDDATGTLYVVATPIGNLGDLGERARQTLERVPWVACEDTRRTGRLLQHLGLHKKLISYWQGNEERRSPALIQRLLAGEDGALVSDAGTPLLSDPGYRVVAAAREEGLRIVPVPGPCAAVAALSASGLPPVPFYFLGFLPRNRAKAKKRLLECRGLSATVVLYESAERLVATLRLGAELLGPRPAVVARELTKLYEEFVAGALGDLADRFERAPARGEITLLIGGSQSADAPSPARKDPEELMRLALASGERPRDAARRLAVELGQSRRTLYSLAHELLAQLREGDDVEGEEGSEPLGGSPAAEGVD